MAYLPYSLNPPSPQPSYPVLFAVSEGSVSLPSTFTLTRPRPYAIVKSRSWSFLTEDSGRPSTKVLIGSCPSLAGTSLYTRQCSVPNPGQRRSMRWKIVLLSNLVDIVMIAL
uniref:Uncharacterized protein n=1 Tax=Trichogramma kaykai TaxID=54128 RepID=A0ABD2W7Z3_9HYME